MISFQVEDRNGIIQTVEIPEDINLSVMEVLKASEFPVLATCGGMALCATCHIDVKKGIEKLNSPTDTELDMIDTLPNAVTNSRLACQIRVNAQLEGALLSLMEESN